MAKDKPTSMPPASEAERQATNAKHYAERRKISGPAVTDAADEAARQKRKPIVTAKETRDIVTQPIGSASAYLSLAHTCTQASLRSLYGVLDQDPEADLAHAIDATEKALVRLREAVPLVRKHREDRTSHPTPDEGPTRGPPPAPDLPGTPQAAWAAPRGRSRGK